MTDVPMLMPTGTLDDLVLRSGLQPRRLDAVRRTHARGVELDPLEVTVYASGLRVLEDGNHRLAVARADGWPTIRVVLRDGSSRKEWRFYGEARRRGILPERFITEAEEAAANPALVRLMHERGGVR